MVATKVTVDVASELLSVADVKSHLLITFTDHDTYLGDAVTSARKAIEKYCGISIGEKTVKAIIDVDAFEEIEIPLAPVISVTTVRYKSDIAEYTTAVASEDYDTDGLDFLTFTPFTQGRWELTYQAGYETLPEDLKTYWMRLVSWYFENRGDQGNIPETIKKDLDPYRRLAWQL